MPTDALSFGEPWSFGDIEPDTVVYCNSMVAHRRGTHPDFSRVELERIIACVNACAGIPTEQLLEPSMPDPAPLPMCVELAEQVEGEWSGETGHVDRDARLIDAKVRPLVDFVRSVETAIDYAEEHGHPTVFADLPHLRDKLDAALKAAGAES